MFVKVIGWPKLLLPRSVDEKVIVSEESERAGARGFAGEGGTVPVPARRMVVESPVMVSVSTSAPVDSSSCVGMKATGMSQVDAPAGHVTGCVSRKAALAVVSWAEMASSFGEATFTVWDMLALPTSVGVKVREEGEPTGGVGGGETGKVRVPVSGTATVSPLVVSVRSKTPALVPGCAEEKVTAIWQVGAAWEQKGVCAK